MNPVRPHPVRPHRGLTELIIGLRGLGGGLTG